MWVEDFESIRHDITNLQLQLAKRFFTHDRCKYTNETGEPEQIIQEKYFMFWNLGRAQGPSYFAKIEI